MTHYLMDLGPAEVSQIFAQKGWQYYDGPPSPAKVFGMMQYVIETVRDDPEREFESCGRLIAYRHPEMQDDDGGTIEIALVLGHVTDVDTKGIKGDMNP
jgi:hypothetical protein